MGRDGMTIREACRARRPLGGPDAQALEGALQQVERELDDSVTLLRRWCQFAGSNWTDGNLERQSRALLAAYDQRPRTSTGSENQGANPVEEPTKRKESDPPGTGTNAAGEPGQIAGSVGTGSNPVPGPAHPLGHDGATGMEPGLPRDHYIREALEELATVQRGHCNRCVRCGWEFDHQGRMCQPGNCSMRPLPEPRATCAGCGVAFVASEPPPSPRVTPPSEEP